MKLKLQVIINDVPLTFKLDTNKLDRNYDDEWWGYWIVKDKFGYMHEINIDKDENGEFLMTGYDYVWFDRGDFEDGVLADIEQGIYFEKI